LRAILLLKADLNTLNKIVFNNRALPAIKASTILLEVIGEGEDNLLFMLLLGKS
jgi:hypothetical protein